MPPAKPTRVMTDAERARADANRGLVGTAIDECLALIRCRDDFEEARAIAYLAICRAAQGFDPSRGCRFSTYAVHAAVHAIRDEFAYRGPVRPKPCSRYRSAPPRLAEARERIRQMSDRSDQGALCEIPSRSADHVTAIDDEDERRAALAIVADLGGREGHILRARLEGLTLAEVGAEIGYTRERVRQLEAKAVAMVRERMGLDAD